MKINVKGWVYETVNIDKFVLIWCVYETVKKETVYKVVLETNNKVIGDRFD